MPKQYWLQLSQGRYPYTISRSARAKYIRIKLSNKGVLNLVIPVRTALKHGHNFIQSKTAWIEKQLKNINNESDDLPESLNLKLLQETWSINYIEESNQQIVLTEDPKFTLVIQGVISDKELVKKLINKWCQQKAKYIFNHMLQELASDYNFHYKKLSIRSQKTRWGSCSNNKNISLNSKLLFFDKHIVQYVMIHELCHTIEMNHSKRFWDLVYNCDPNYQKNQRQLKTLGSLLPI